MIFNDIIFSSSKAQPLNDTIHLHFYFFSLLLPLYPKPSAVSLIQSPQFCIFSIETHNSSKTLSSPFPLLQADADTESLLNLYGSTRQKATQISLVDRYW